MTIASPFALKRLIPVTLLTATMLGAGCQGSNDSAAKVPYSSHGNQPVLSMVAGKPSGHGYVDGSLSASRFSFPTGMRFDAAGNLYVVDMRNSVIRRIDRNGTVATIAGTVGQTGGTDGRGAAARFNYPTDIAVDAAGVVYVADAGNNTIRKILQDGTVTTWAGAVGQAGSDNGSVSKARFNGPNGLAFDAQGNLYVVDSWNCTIRKITPTGMVSTIAGKAGGWGYADGVGPTAQFNGPTAIAIDAAGILYVTDGSNTIRRITADGTVTTFAGAAWQGGEVDGAAAIARFNGPTGIVADKSGNVYVSDTYGNTLRKISPDGKVSTIAGSRTPGSKDGVGAAASFTSPNRLAIDGAGNLYVTSETSAIRRIDVSAMVTTWAGASSEPGSTDGPALSARLNFPNGLVVDKAGSIFIADQDNSTVRKIDASGNVTTLAGSVGVWGWADGIGQAAQFNGVGSVAVAPDGNVFASEYYGNTIRKITPDGKVTTFAGAAVAGDNRDGAGTDARFNAPNFITADQGGTLYVADYGNNTIRKISPTGIVSTFAGSGRPGSADGKGAEASFNGPNSIAIDEGGNLFVTDSVNNTIRKITPSGVVSTLAGFAGATGSADGAGKSARFSYPWGIALDRKGNLYVADSNNNAIRKVSSAGVVTTVAGGAGQYANVVGKWPVQIAYPISVAFDAQRNRMLVTAPHAVMSIPAE